MDAGSCSRNGWQRPPKRLLVGPAIRDGCHIKLTGLRVGRTLVIVGGRPHVEDYPTSPWDGEDCAPPADAASPRGHLLPIPCCLCPWVRGRRERKGSSVPGEEAL